MAMLSEKGLAMTQRTLELQRLEVCLTSAVQARDKVAAKRIEKLINQHKKGYTK